MWQNIGHRIVFTLLEGHYVLFRPNSIFRPIKTMIKNKMNKILLYEAYSIQSGVQFSKNIK